MKMETKYNIGDRAWAVIHQHGSTNRTCTSCNGEGGAVIPGTRINVVCSDCKGGGTEEVGLNYFDVAECRINEIEVRARETRDTPDVRIIYFGYYRSAVHATPFMSVFDTEEEAVTFAKSKGATTYSEAWKLIQGNAPAEGK